MSKDDGGDVRQIVALSRLPHSRNGNPRWLIHWLGGSSSITQTDAAIGYAIGNPGLQVGDWVTVTVTRAGRVTHLESAPVPSVPGSERADVAAAVAVERERIAAWAEASLTHGAGIAHMIRSGEHWEGGPGDDQS